MLLKSDIAIHILRERVWDFLTDPHQIGQCALGAEKSQTYFHTLV